MSKRRGEKTGDLPVQAPTKHHLAINLKATKASDHHSADRARSLRRGDRITGRKSAIGTREALLSASDIAAHLSEMIAHQQRVMATPTTVSLLSLGGEIPFPGFGAEARRRPVRTYFQEHSFGQQRHGGAVSPSSARGRGIGRSNRLGHRTVGQSPCPVEAGLRLRP